MSLIPLCPGLATGRETRLRERARWSGSSHISRATNCVLVVDAEIRNSDMRFSLFVRPVVGAALLTLSALAATAVAAPTDYRFELAQAQPAGPGKTDLTVRLVHVPDKKPVAGAVLFETKADMTPDGMADMTGKVTPLVVRPAGPLPFPDRDGHGRQLAAQPWREGPGRDWHGARHRPICGGEMTCPARAPDHPRISGPLPHSAADGRRGGRAGPIRADVRCTGGHARRRAGDSPPSQPRSRRSRTRYRGRAGARRDCRFPARSNGARDLR